jgi:hypothetical protein
MFVIDEGGKRLLWIAELSVTHELQEQSIRSLSQPLSSPLSVQQLGGNRFAASITENRG